MDTQTIATYNKDAKSIGELHKSLVPERLYDLSKTYFYPNAKTLDLGCGIGRDTNWLNQNGFNAIGIDGSIEMLNLASLHYPQTLYIHDYLPELENTNNDQFVNIFCSAVLMHLSPENIQVACEKIVALVGEQACILISYRDTSHPDFRENGKLYTPIDTALISRFFAKNGFEVIINETTIDNTRGLNWTNLVFKK